MVTVGSRTRAFDHAGAVHTLLAPWAFIGDVLVSKRGDLAVAYRLQGVDYEGLDQDSRQQTAHRFETALRLLSEDWRVYSYLTKRRAAPLTATPVENPVIHAALQRRVAHWNRRGNEMYTLDLHLVLQYEGLRRQLPSAGTIDWLAPWRWASTSALAEDLQQTLERALGHVDQVSRSVDIHLAESLRPHRLKHAAFLWFLRHLVTYDPIIAEAAPLRSEAVDVAMANSSIACEPTHLEIGAKTVQVLSMTEPPTLTAAHLLEHLYALPGEFLAVLEWRRLDPGPMRRAVIKHQNHASNTSRSFMSEMFAVLSGTPAETRHARTDAALVDPSKIAEIEQLGQSRMATDFQGHFWGECSLTVALLGADLRTTTALHAEALKVMAAHDGHFHLETMNQLNAWLSIVPGHYGTNVRRLKLMETNAADLSFLFTLDQGNRVAPALDGQDALFVFETQTGTPYFYNLHVDDVGHTLVLGSTGSGKSFLIGTLVLSAQKYHPRTVVFDVGHSYRGLANVLGGSYLTLGVRPPDFAINPFALDPTPEHKHFQHAFVSVLLSGADGYTLSDQESSELYQWIDHLPMLPVSERRLRTVASVLPPYLKHRLAPWIEGGQYGGWFDHAEDTFEPADCQVFDFSAMTDFPQLFEPVLFYVLHRTFARLSEPGAPDRFLLAVIDEAWALVRHPALRNYVETALKTWRKHHAAIILATQAVEDLTKTELLRPALEHCPTTLFLANPKLDRRKYAEWFGLSETQLDMLASITRRREVVLKRQGLMKRLIVEVDPETHTVLSGGGPRLVERMVG